MSLRYADDDPMSAPRFLVSLCLIEMAQRVVAQEMEHVKLQARVYELEATVTELCEELSRAEGDGE